MANNLRIISGKYKGMSFDGDSIIGTRPTMNRVKESLFAMIQEYLKDSACLDLFAGSGNLGLESLSNGANSCYFVDNNPIAVSTIKKNLTKLKVIEETQVLLSDYQNALVMLNKKNIQFDIIFLDPPYQDNLISNCLGFIQKYNILKDNGIIVCEYENENICDNGFKVLKERTYGTKNIVILTK